MTALISQLVFRRHAHQRTLDFSTIAEAAQIDINEVSFLLLLLLLCLLFLLLLLSFVSLPSSCQVEILVMKALSLGLVKGNEGDTSYYYTHVMVMCWSHAQELLMRWTSK